jgi:hypothetical protein
LQSGPFSFLILLLLRTSLIDDLLDEGAGPLKRPIAQEIEHLIPFFTR